MREKISKIVLLILSIILIYKIVEISAAYKTGLQADANADIEPWKILVNGKNIATTETEIFELESYIDKSDYVAEGKLAPGSRFKVPVEIDATATDNMDIRYDIKVDMAVEQENYSTIQIQNVLEENQNCEIIKTGENTYTGIMLKENIKKHNISINFIWENNEENNKIDTTIGTNLEERQKISIPITISVSQYGNEEIEEYIGENES